MLIDVSLGESIDKFSILTIKSKKIKDKEKLEKIYRELFTLKDIKEIIEKNLMLYNILKYINEIIWEQTDIVDENNDINAMIKCFEYNKYRFRLKNILNQNSIIKEQKNTKIKSINLFFEKFEDVHQLIPDIFYLIMKFDKIIFHTKFNEKLKNIFTFSCFIYEDISDNMKYDKLEENIPSDKKIFTPDTIKYLGSGRLGDFILQISVIKENYMYYGRKGDLFLSNEWEFRNSLEKTYDELKCILEKLDYINSFSIHNGEKYDINLSNWRHGGLLGRTTWIVIFSNFYKISWGKYPWMIGNIQEKYKNSVVIHICPYRLNIYVDYKKMLSKEKRKIIFISTNDDEYIESKKYSNGNETLKIENLKDMNDIIYSSDLFIGNMSAPLTLAQAMHKNCIALLNGISDYIHNIRLDTVIPNYKWYFDENNKNVDIYNY